MFLLLPIENAKNLFQKGRWQKTSKVWLEFIKEMVSNGIREIVCMQCKEELSLPKGY